MTLLDGLLIFLALIVLYGLAVYVLHKKGILKKYNISLYGPALMWRTQRGIKFLKKRARHIRLWCNLGNASIVFCFLAMAIMTSVLIWSAIIISGFTPIQRQALPGPEFALALPGINPILPLEYIGYILIGIIIAIVVHEFSHGILTLVSKLKVKSLGLLYLIVPIGAFCEPDEENLTKAPIKSRMRIYSVGPASNFAITILSLLIFSFLLMSAVQPAHTGAVVLQTENDSPAQILGLKAGNFITSLNGSSITNSSDFLYAVNKIKASQKISISFIKDGLSHNSSIILGDKFVEYAKRNYQNNESFKGMGYIGIRIAPDFLKILKNPFLEFPWGALSFYAIPIYGYYLNYNPLIAPFSNTFTIVGPLSVIPQNIFWILANSLYWIFWLNLAFALFNVLPMIPLDGGFIFIDGVRSLIQRMKQDISEEKRDAIAKNVSLAISLIILFVLIIPFFIKYIP